MLLRTTKDENVPRPRYPIAFEQTHFPDGFGFREIPPTPEMTGGARRQTDRAHRFFQESSSGRLAKFLVVLTEHATPYYGDSYSRVVYCIRQQLPC
jgi:hypothetical protein